MYVRTHARTHVCMYVRLYFFILNSIKVTFVKVAFFSKIMTGTF